jgi:hypothetical protein
MNEDLTKVVDELNDEIFRRDEMAHELFTYSYSGWVNFIYFANIPLWNDEEDERLYNEHLENYEPIKDFLKRTLKKKALEMLIISKY